MAALPDLDYRGFTFYPGHIKDQNEEKIAELSETIARLRDEFIAAGLTPKIVSGGSTPLLFRSHEVAGLNEIRPGTYVFNDLNTVAGGGCALEDCAASVLVTVVSHTQDRTDDCRRRIEDVLVRPALLRRTRAWAADGSAGRGVPQDERGTRVCGSLEGGAAFRRRETKSGLSPITSASS